MNERITHIISRFSSLSIKTKLFVLLLLISCITVLIESVGVINISRTNLKARLEHERVITSDYLIKVIEQYFVDFNRKLSFIENIERSGVEASPHARAILFEALAKNNELVCIATIDQAGTVTNSVSVDDTGILFPENIAADPLMKVARETGRISFSLFKAPPGKPVMRLAYPLLRNAGCLYIIANVDRLQYAIANSAKSGDLIIALVDRDHHILFDTAGTISDKNIAGLKLENSALSASIKDMSSKAIRTYVQPLVLEGTYLMVGQYADVLNRPIRTMISVTVIWLLITGGIVFFIALIAARYFLDPLTRLAAKMSDAGKGNLDTTLEIKHQDEIGKIAATFNDMMAKLKELNGELVKNERLATIGQLSATIGHEIRNPLQSIGLTASLLAGQKADSLKPDDIRKFGELIRQSLFVINKISENLLGYSRERPPATEDVDLSAVVADVLKSLKPPDNVHLITEIQPGITFKGEIVEIRQVFINLTDNAIDVMRKKGGHVILGAKMVGARIIISFADNGPGISEENMKKLFKPLFSTKAKGTGLGLAVVKRIVERHKGKIEVTSRVNVGTTFTVTLPRT